jgi:hypothetical protein
MEYGDCIMSLGGMGVGVAAQGEIIDELKFTEINHSGRTGLIACPTDVGQNWEKIHNNLQAGATREMGTAPENGVLTDFMILINDSTTTEPFDVILNEAVDDFTAPFGNPQTIGTVPAGTSGVFHFTGLSVALVRGYVYKFGATGVIGATGTFNPRYSYTIKYGTNPNVPSTRLFFNRWLEIPTATPSAHFGLQQYLYSISNNHRMNSVINFDGTLSKVSLMIEQYPTSGIFKLHIYKNDVDVWEDDIFKGVGQNDFEPNVLFDSGDTLRYEIEKSLSTSNAYFKLTTMFTGVSQ